MSDYGGDEGEAYVEEYIEEQEEQERELEERGNASDSDNSSSGCSSSDSDSESGSNAPNEEDALAPPVEDSPSGGSSMLPGAAMMAMGALCSRGGGSSSQHAAPAVTSYGIPAGIQQQRYGSQQPLPQQYQQGPVHFQPEYPANAPFHFKYSECNGRRRALLVGINYVGQKGELRGCWNDVENVSEFLMQRFGYRIEDMVILRDDSSLGQRQQPTKQNILEAMSWLVQGAAPNDSLFFHFSGHGGQTKDIDGDEADGTDETIYPIDHEENGCIVDDQMHDILVSTLPEGCRLTAIFDSCHSGSALDLPYMYDTSGQTKEPNFVKDAGTGAMQIVKAYKDKYISSMLTGLKGLGKKWMNREKADAAHEKTRLENTSPADVIMWSGCKDIQTSADATEEGEATGAMSYALIAALTKYPRESYVQLLNVIRDELEARGYSQKPQLSSSHEMDMSLLYIM